MYTFSRKKHEATTIRVVPRPPDSHNILTSLLQKLVKSCHPKLLDSELNIKDVVRISKRTWILCKKLQKDALSWLYMTKNYQNDSIRSYIPS